MITYIVGDVVSLAKRGEFDALLHGCNCFNTMGSGVAKTIKANFPEAYTSDLNTKKGDFSKGGGYSKYEYENLTVYNLYTQFNYGKGNLFKPHWLESALSSLRGELTGKKVGLPYIGCGLAGGSEGDLIDVLDKFPEINFILVRWEGDERKIV